MAGTSTAVDELLELAMVVGEVVMGGRVSGGGIRVKGTRQLFLNAP